MATATAKKKPSEIHLVICEDATAARRAFDEHMSKAWLDANDGQVHLARLQLTDRDGRSTWYLSKFNIEAVRGLRLTSVRTIGNIPTGVLETANNCVR
jgi:hypothetical protein